ncbi:MAG: response regulator [Betaproteobacteria bacterium]|nr:response regulator [Betaproteobacteria bacterium]MBV9360944.1 response regulator [Betaproteobacteria bacterium]
MSRPAESRVSVFSAENRAEVPVYPLDVFVLTDAGASEIHGGTTRLPAEALAVLVILDGKKTVADLEQAMPHVPAENLRNVVRSLLGAGLLRAPTLAEQSGGVEVDFDAFFKAADGGGETSSPAAEKSADREAVYGAPELEREGYYVSIARQAVKARAPAGGGKFNVLVVEDDPDMCALIERLLGRDIFTVKACGKRDEVLAQLRQRPSPDAILLDIHLPDLNGFELLQKLKTHPDLKLIPVVIVTAEAKPESVMRGLALGADGYITKPFDHTALVRGVKAVLGVS